jgi:hypothetical protein
VLKVASRKTMDNRHRIPYLTVATADSFRRNPFP